MGSVGTVRFVRRVQKSSVARTPSVVKWQWYTGRVPSFLLSPVATSRTSGLIYSFYSICDCTCRYLLNLWVDCIRFIRSATAHRSCVTPSSKLSRCGVHCLKSASVIYNIYFSSATGSIMCQHQCRSRESSNLYFVHSSNVAKAV